MSQYSVPTTLIDAGGWSGAPSAAADSPPTASSATYLQAPAGASHSQVYKATLSLEWSPVPTGARLYYSLDKDVVGGDTLETRVQIVDGTGRALITPRTVTVVSPTEGYISLTEAEALAIAASDTRQVWISSQAVSSAVLAQGVPYTLTGTGFGTKGTPSPWHWDDFSAGPHGVTLDGRQGLVGGRIYQQYNTTHRDNPARTQFYGYSDGTGRAGKRSFRKTCTGDNFASSYLSGINAREVFATWWFRLKLDSGAGDEAINKLMRFNVGAAYTGTPSVLMVANGVTTAGWRNVRFSQDDGTGGGIPQSYLNDGHVPAIDNTGTVWYRFEVYLKLSTPGVADGAVGVGILGYPYYEDETVATCAATVSPTATIAHVFAPEMQLANGGDAPLYLTLDANDMYIDTTRQRVELGNAAVWSGCTVREIQPATAWSPTSITITGNKGQLGAGTQYLYVVRSDGTRVSDLGTPVTVV